MERNLKILFYLLCGLATSYTFAEDLEFKVSKQALRISPLGLKGHNIYLNDKLVHFVPISNRSDLQYATEIISDYGLDASQKELLSKHLSDAFNESIKSADSKDLIEASFLMAKESSNIMTKELKEDCLKSTETLVNEKEKKQKEEEIYCECEMKNELKLSPDDHNKLSKNFGDKYWEDFSLIGEVEEVSFSIDTTNDNHLHGLWRQMASKEYDGNDRGRTFGINLDYKAVGDLGEIQLSYESTLFTQMKETSPGSNKFYVDKDRKFLQDQLERNRFDFKLLRKYGESDSFVIGGFELQQSTDDGTLAGPLQDAWHSLLKEQSIEYNNQEFMKDDIDFTIYGGLGKDFILILVTGSVEQEWRGQ